MKLWITEAMNPSQPHVDYIAANTRPQAEAAAKRLGNIKIVGELHTQLPSVAPRDLMRFVESRCTRAPVKWDRKALARLEAFLNSGGRIQEAPDGA